MLVVIRILFDIYRMCIIRSLSKLFDKKKNHQEICSKYTNVVFALSPKANRLDLTETYTVSLYFMVYFQTYHFNCHVVFYCVIFFSCLLLMSSNQKIIWLCGSGFIYVYIIFIRHLIIYSPGIKEKHFFVTASRVKHIHQLHYIICDTTIYFFFVCDSRCPPKDVQ